MNANRKRNEALNIADFKTDDILSASDVQLLGEVGEDCGDPFMLAAEFDAIASPVISRHLVGAVNRGDAPTTARQPVPLAGSRAAAPWTFLQAALARLSEWLVASPRPRIALGAFATVLLVAILTPAIYPWLLEHSTDRAAQQANSTVQNEGRTPRAIPAVRPTSDPKDRIGQITQFVNAYDGGDCFFVGPVSIAEHQATLEGYGSTVAPFEKLGNEFKRNIGFEAFIRAHRVAPAQCAAVNFLSRARNRLGLVPSLDLRVTALRGGEALSGTVADFGSQELVLLLVADDGSVRNLTNVLRTTGNTKSFSVQVQSSGYQRAQPNLLLAIAENKPLDALTRAPLGSADQVFAQLLVEVQRDGRTLSVGTRFFTVEK
jgi:hypothetical protein